MGQLFVQHSTAILTSLGPQCMLGKQNMSSSSEQVKCFALTDSQSRYEEGQEGTLSNSVEGPWRCHQPLQGWAASVRLSDHAKEESFYFYFAKRGFPMKWMPNVIKCLFIIHGFSLLVC